MQNLA